MLKITNKQMDVFTKAVRKPNKAELKMDLNELYTALPDEELENFINLGLEKSSKYGIDEFFAVKDFIRLMIVVALDFDTYPPVKEQLTRKDVDPNLTVQLACELITPSEWQEAKTYGQRASDRTEDDYVQEEISNILSN